MAKAKDEPGTNVVNRDEELRRQIETQRKMLGAMGTSAKFISFKGGNIIVDKKAIPGAKTNVVLLALMGERTYFAQDFDPDESQSPDCYAYFEPDADKDDIAPHKEAPDPQNKTCEGCQWNEWGTAKKGRGKRCRESIRVALVPAQKDLGKAELRYARIPITSVPAFMEHAEGILNMDKPLHSVVSELSVTPDDRTFFKVHWAIAGATPPPAKNALDNKALSAQKGIWFPYPKFDEEPKKPAKPIKGQRK